MLPSLRGGRGLRYFILFRGLKASLCQRNTTVLRPVRLETLLIVFLSGDNMVAGTHLLRVAYDLSPSLEGVSEYFTFCWTRVFLLFAEAGRGGGGETGAVYCCWTYRACNLPESSLVIFDCSTVRKTTQSRNSFWPWGSPLIFSSFPTAEQRYFLKSNVDSTSFEVNC